MRVIPSPIADNGTSSGSPMSTRIIGVPVAELSSTLTKRGSMIRRASVSSDPCFLARSWPNRTESSFILPMLGDTNSASSRITSPPNQTSSLSTVKCMLRSSALFLSLQESRIPHGVPGLPLDESRERFRICRERASRPPCPSEGPTPCRTNELPHSLETLRER